MPRSVLVHAPATVANVGAGFDVLGLAVSGPGDHVRARRVEEPGLRLVAISGDGGRLPREASANVASVAARAVIERLALVDVGVELEIEKGLPLSSGLGGSAASSVAAAVAIDQLFEAQLPREELLAAALEGERVAAGTAHADNAAPALYGGLVIVRRTPPRVVPLPVPDGLMLALVHPHLELETRAARAVLPNEIPIGDAVEQMANVASFVAALAAADLDLLARSLDDVIAEPRRAPLIHGYQAAKASAIAAGALGAGISGSGPSVFALARDLESAESAALAMFEAFRDAGIEADRWVSPLPAPGARVVEVVP